MARVSIVSWNLKEAGGKHLPKSMAATKKIGRKTKVGLCQNRRSLFVQYVVKHEVEVLYWLNYIR